MVPLEAVRAPQLPDSLSFSSLLCSPYADCISHCSDRQHLVCRQPHGSDLHVLLHVPQHLFTVPAVLSQCTSMLLTLHLKEAASQDRSACWGCWPAATARSASWPLIYSKSSTTCSSSSRSISSLGVKQVSFQPLSAKHTHTHTH